MSDYARAQEELIRMREDFRQILALAEDKPTAGHHKDIAEIARRNVPETQSG